MTIVERGGEPVAVIVHDRAFEEDPALIASVSAALRLAVENERLAERVTAQLAEVRASRARIVEAGDTERRRVERDLHDGAQQRIVALTLALRTAQNSLGPDAEPAARDHLDHALEEARAALAELRELARGIHPQILTSAGLAAAVGALAQRSSVDVAVRIAPEDRYEPAIESAAYFVISEALANVAKYAAASKVTIAADWRDSELMVEIADDGVGGAAASTGSGLQGLADRLAALDGQLEIRSPVGGGTRVLARIPSSAPTPNPV
jgi:signal transduction histidine kinase